MRIIGEQNILTLMLTSAFGGNYNCCISLILISRFCVKENIFKKDIKWYCAFCDVLDILLFTKPLEL